MLQNLQIDRVAKADEGSSIHMKLLPSPFAYDFAECVSRPGGAKRYSRSMLLIGPGKHFGAELVRRFLAEGFEVGVMTSSTETASDLQAVLGDNHGPVLYAVADISEPTSFTQALQRLAARLSKIECVIYNPKLSISGSGLMISPADLSTAMAVNVTGALIAIQAMLPFLQRVENARVILTGGGFKDKPDADRFALSIGKTILHGLVHALRGPLSSKGIALKTVVIDGAVRRHQHGCSGSEDLAEFFWGAFSHTSGYVHNFPVQVEYHPDQLSFQM